MPVTSTLSEPLLPTATPAVEGNGTGRLQGAGNHMSGRLKAMSFPFSQQELLSNVARENSGSGDILTTLRAATKKLDWISLNHLAMVGETARLGRYQRTRPAEIVVPTDGPSWQQVSCIVATTLIGAGVLGLPYAMRMAGWAGLILILAVTLITSFTAKMLIWSFNEINEIKQREGQVNFVATYDHLAEEVAGAWASSAMKALTVLECYGCAVCYVVLHSVNWPVVLSLPDYIPLTDSIEIPAPVASVSVWAACVLPLLLVKVKYLAVFGSVGLVALSILFAVSTMAPAFGGEPQAIGTACPPLDSSTSADDTLGPREWLRADGLGVGIGLVLFCFGGHATFPEIYSQMTADERPHFDKAINVGFLVAAMFFSVLSAAGYFYYGSCAADTLTLNLMETSPLLGRISTVCVLANTFLSFPTFCAPVIRILTELVHTEEAVDHLEADVVPPTEEQLWRESVTGRVDALANKLDAIGTALLHLATSVDSKLPREVQSTLRTPSPRPRPRQPSGVFTAETLSEPSLGASSMHSHGGAEEMSNIDEDAAALEGSSSSCLQAMSSRSLLVRVGLVVVAAALAVSVPNFGFVVALMGAFTTMLVSFILPTAFFLRVRWGSLSRLQVTLCVGVLLVGFAGMFVGLVNTLGDGA